MSPHDSEHAGVAHPSHDLPSSEALLQIADTCFGEGFVALAGHVASLASRAGAPLEVANEAKRRSNDARAVDDAAMRLGLHDDEFVVPSIERQADGTPSFLLPIPAEVAGQAEVMQVVAQEICGEGVDAELRVFLGVMIEPGDAFVDCDPGFGLASLSAATRHPGRVTVISRAADDDHAAFLRRACHANAIYDIVVEAPAAGRPSSLDAMLQNPKLSRATRLLIHAGQADDIGAMLAELTLAVRNPHLAAIVWSIGSDEATQQVADALAELGTQHFIVANDAEGAVLVPQHAVTGATLIVSLTANALSDRQAA